LIAPQEAERIWELAWKHGVSSHGRVVHHASSTVLRRRFPANISPAGTYFPYSWHPRASPINPFAALARRPNKIIKPVTGSTFGCGSENVYVLPQAILPPKSGVAVGFPQRERIHEKPRGPCPFLEREQLARVHDHVWCSPVPRDPSPSTDTAVGERIAIGADNAHARRRALELSTCRLPANAEFWKSILPPRKWNRPDHAVAN